MTEVAPNPSPLRAVGFRWYLAALVAAMLANEFMTMAVGWQLYEATKDPWALGLVGLAGALPFMATVLVGGHLADRRDRRHICLWSFAGLIVCSLALVLLSASGVAEAHHWTIYLVVACSALARSFLMPARGALCSELVPRETLEVATRLRSTIFQLGSVIGRAASGFVYALGAWLGLGAAFTYGVVAVLLVAAMLMMAAIRIPSRARSSDHEPMIASLVGGVRFVTGNRALLGAMLLDLLGVLFGDAIILLPIFADQVFRLGPQGAGLLRAAPAVGAVLMAFVLMGRPPFAQAGRTLLWAVGCFGLSQIGFALSPWFPLAAVFLAIGGALDFVSVVVRNAMLQVMTPSHLLGRVTSVQQVFIWSSNELGALESGAAARLLGLVPSVVAGGLVTVGATLGIAWRNGPLRRLGRITPPETDNASGAQRTELAAPVADAPEAASVR